MRKDVTKLTEQDFVSHPLWRYLNDDSLGELIVESVDEWPVPDLSGFVVGASVILKSGKICTAVFSNVDVSSSERNSHFLALSIWNNRRRFHLARYHDRAQEKFGPQALANLLGLSVDDVFPIKYDLTQFVLNANASVLINEVPLEPKNRLTRREIISLAVEG
jgi:hypothetical protein